LHYKLETTLSATSTTGSLAGDLQAWTRKDTGRSDADYPVFLSGAGKIAPVLLSANLKSEN